MRELALNILDIAQNSITAQAENVKITVCADFRNDSLIIRIDDDGKGMSEEFLKRVIDPFTTTRTTRKVGMGIPLFKFASESAGGKFEITSKENVGTSVIASFKISHIDRMPLGDVADTMAMLIRNSKNVDFEFNYIVDENKFEFSTREVKKILGCDDISDYTTIEYIKEMIQENINTVNGGKEL